MRLSACLLVLSLAGILGGAALIATWVLGLAIIADSLLLGAWTLFRDDGTGRREPGVHAVPTLADVLEKARRAG
jgi:hypothetical protein